LCFFVAVNLPSRTSQSYALLSLAIGREARTGIEHAKQGSDSYCSHQQKSLICLPDKLGFFELSVPQAEREVCFASEAHFMREVCLAARYAEHLTSPLRRSNFTMPQGITSLRLAATSLLMIYNASH